MRTLKLSVARTKKKINANFRGAFFAWLKSLIGDRAFAFALLRHGIFKFSDLAKCAHYLRLELNTDPDVPQARYYKPNPQLREAALTARRNEKDAKKYAMWQRKGWHCTPAERHQIILLDNGTLAKQVRDANKAYGFGRGAEKALSREEAMTLEVFTNQVLKDYMK